MGKEQAAVPSDNEKSLEALKASRASTKGSISRIKTLVESKDRKFEYAELECRLGIVESYFKQVLNYQTRIEDLCPSDTCRGELEELYCVTKARILSLMGPTRRPSGVEMSFAIPQPSSRLPQLRLPKFSGKYSEYKNFISTFKTLVDSDASLSGIEKFNHLVHCLSEQALGTVKAFQITEENYPKALKRLEERYDNTCLIFLEYISMLFDLPKMKNDSPTQLRALVDNVSALFDSLTSLGNHENISNAIIIYLVMSKVDSETQIKWDESLDYSKLPKWTDCTTVLNKRCQFLESRESKSLFADTGRLDMRSRQHTRKPTHTSLPVTNSSCSFCKSPHHAIVDCNKFKNLNVYDRFKIAKRLSLCINCLKKGHEVSNCSSKRCDVCSDPHHLLLHRYNTSRPQGEPSTSSQLVGNTRTTLHNAIDVNVEPQVVLATVVVKVKNQAGDFVFARALLDSGSQINLMTEALANNLGLKTLNSPIDISGVGDITAKIHSKTRTTVQSRFDNFEKNIEFWVARSITDFQPQHRLQTKDWRIPREVSLADPLFYKPQTIDMLLGADLFFDLIKRGHIKLGPNLPIMQNTLLGWIVSGAYCANGASRQSCNLLEKSLNKTCRDLEKLVERFWRTEEISNKIIRTPEQIICEQHFVENVRILENGRFRVKLPFKDNPRQLGSSFEIARNRFLSLERRLNRNPDLKVEYAKFIQEYLDLGHMSMTSKIDFTQPHYYMPHQCVLRPDSLSTKLRVVFDASCQTTSNICLNNILMVGPTIQEEMSMIVLRFRCHRYVLTADIKKMYRQVEIDPEDRKYQLILWRDDPKEDLKTFQLNTVTYGTSSAPFLATRCLKELGVRCSEEFPLGAKVVLRDFYVDDLLTGANSVDDLHRIQREVNTILKSAHFELHKWQSNVSLDTSTETTNVDLNVDDLETTKTLGISWNPRQDTFQYCYKDSFSPSKLTKRSILSSASRLFDPLGLICPIVVKAKMFLKSLWMEKLDWDDALPEAFDACWKEYTADLRNLNAISIPRFIFQPHFRNVQIHGFSDASTKAYGCCLYARCEDELGNVSVNLIAGKSKVAPEKTLSLPRLELCGAQMLAKLWSKVKAAFEFAFEHIYFWVDSKIVLCWLDASPSAWETFVANRVSNIQWLSSGVYWRHVRSENNPADLISRGCNVKDLQHTSWFAGPDFLRRGYSEWPNNAKLAEFDVREPLLERKKRKSIFACEFSGKEFSEIFYRHSSYVKTLWIVAYMLKFITAARGNRSTGIELSGEDLNNALITIVWYIQQQNFAKEIAEIKAGRSTSNPKLAKLCLVLDETGKRSIVRVGGRIGNADIALDQKFPMLLPNDNPFVKNYVRYVHRSNFHAGPQALLNFVRDRFWIVNGRIVVRQIVRNCVHCRRYKPKLLQQIMGNLPKDRLTSTRPFSVCGVDFCGPILTSWKIRGKQPYKTYIAVFVCFSSKAVHLELVSDLTSDAFIAALKRLIGRRGCPTKIYCDNATNFVGARTKLAEFRNKFFTFHNKTNILSFASEKMMEFKFIPPRAPHFGGLWEAAMKSAKGLLYKTLGSALLSFEELATALVEIEGILNSRPITAVSSDPNDICALTPGHFLIGSAINSFQEPNFLNDKFSYLNRWQRVSAIKQHFWKRWLSEYFKNIQVRSKWFTTQPNIKEGSLVMVHEDNLTPYKWELARVTKAIKGGDGKVRVVELKTSSGSYRRPIAKIAPILEDGD